MEHHHDRSREDTDHRSGRGRRGERRDSHGETKRARSHDRSDSHRTRDEERNSTARHREDPKNTRYVAYLTDIHRDTTVSEITNALYSSKFKLISLHFPFDTRYGHADVEFLDLRSMAQAVDNGSFSIRGQQVLMRTVKIYPKTDTEDEQTIEFTAKDVKRALRYPRKERGTRENKGRHRDNEENERHRHDNEENKDGDDQSFDSSEESIEQQEARYRYQSQFFHDDYDDVDPRWRG